MNILLKNQSLLKPGSLEILRAGVIHQLSRIQEAGFHFLLDETLPESLRQLLENEGLRFSQSTDTEAEVIIGTDEVAEKLLIRKTGGLEFICSNWAEMAHLILFPPRLGVVHRKTNETDIAVKVNLDGTGKHQIETGLGFFDHMLEQIARHGFIDLELSCKGDLQIDEHHTIEDCALAFGEALSQAIGDKRGIERYASVLPMDESRAMVALDLSGRPYLVFEGEFKRDKVGDVPTDMIKHFFYSLAMNMKATLHVEFSGDNDHHQIEACFKGFAKVLRDAVRRTGGNQIPSSKGIL